MKTVTIGGEDYTFEFTIEAALYNECTEKIIGLLTDVADAQNKDDIKRLLSSMTDVPQTTLTMFYAGLLEHHGTDAGDGRIASKKDAKLLIRKYFDEHKDDGQGNFFSVMEMLIGVMNDDGFFKQIGLEQMVGTGAKAIAQTQDHKRKAGKATGK